MYDFRGTEIQCVRAGSKITVLKGGSYICEIVNSKEFKEVLAGNFHQFTGLTGDTLIKLGELVKEFEADRISKNEAN